MPQTVGDKKYKRILLKLSGEALTGQENFGIDPKILDQMALEVGQLVGIGVQVGLVVGGGQGPGAAGVEMVEDGHGQRRPFGGVGARSDLVQQDQ